MKISFIIFNLEMCKTMKKFIVTVLAIALSTSTVQSVSAAELPVASAARPSTSTAQPTTSAVAKNQLESDALTKEKARDVEEALTLINSVPDDVLKKGDKATQEWLQKQPAVKSQKEKGAVEPYADAWGCTLAIAWLLGSTVVSAAKILKIKKYIQALGGVKEAVQVMWGASFTYEKMQAAGGALAGLAAELIGITSVRNQCFS